MVAWLQTSETSRNLTLPCFIQQSESGRSRTSMNFLVCISVFNMGQVQKIETVLKHVFVAIFATFYFPIIFYLKARTNTAYHLWMVFILLMEIRMLSGWLYCKYMFLCYFYTVMWINSNLQNIRPWNKHKLYKDISNYLLECSKWQWGKLSHTSNFVESGEFQGTQQ